jgi:hypothetical protein
MFGLLDPAYEVDPMIFAGLSIAWLVVMVILSRWLG